MRVTNIIKDFQASKDYAENSYHKKWDTAWKLYNNQRTDRGYEGIADAFIPETHTIVESLVANIAGTKPKFEFVPLNEEQEDDTEVLNQMMDYYWECNHMDLKSQQWVREMLLYGNSLLHVTWKDGKPFVENVPLKNFIVDPTATSLETARYAGFRYLANKTDLRNAKTMDPKTGKMVSKYRNLNRVSGGYDPDDMDKQEKDLFNGSTIGKQALKDQVEVILMYYMNEKKVVEVANRTTVIREVDSPFQRAEKTANVEIVVDGELRKVKKTLPKIDAFFPFALLRNYVDPSLFYAKGEVEVIAGLQENLNDLENQDQDNISYTNNVMWQIDPQFADMAPEIESVPGAVYPIPRGALAPIERPTLTQDLDRKKYERKEEMRRATAADEVIQGVSQDQGRITATEVAAQLNQANQRFSTKIRNLESEGFAQLASIMLKLVQIFVDTQVVVRIVGPEGVKFKDFDPALFAGEYEPHVKLASTIQQVKLEEGQKLNQMYQIILGNPVVNQGEAVRFILENMGAEKEDVQRMLTLESGSEQPQLGSAPQGETALDPGLDELMDLPLDEVIGGLDG